MAPVPRPQWPPTGAKLDGGHCGPRLNLGLCSRFQGLNLSQIDPVNDGEAVLAGPCAGLDKDAFLQERAHGSLDRGLSQLGMPLNRTLGTPDTGAIIARLVSQKHDDLLACCAAKLPFRACVRNPPAHWNASKCAQACEICTGFVRDFRRFSRIRRESSRDFPQETAQCPENKPYFKGVFGDAVRLIRTSLSLRRNA